MHQVAAAAAVFGVIQQWNVRGSQQRNGIAAEGFLRTRAAIPIAVGEAVQLMPALSVSLVQPAGPLFAPGMAVVVFQQHSNVYASLLRRDQRFRNPRQAELLHSHQHLFIGGVNGCNQPLLQVIAIAPGACKG